MGSADLDYVAPDVPVAEPTLEAKVDELLDILRPLRPLIEQAPEFMAEVGPFIQKLQSNPLLKGLLR